MRIDEDGVILRYSRNRHSSSKLLFGFQIFVVIHQLPLLRFFFFSTFRFPGALLSLSSLLSFLITTWCPNLPYHHPPVIFHTFCISPFTLFSRVAFPSFFSTSLYPIFLKFSIILHLPFILFVPQISGWDFNATGSMVTKNVDGVNVFPLYSFIGARQLRSNKSHDVNQSLRQHLRGHPLYLFHNKK